MKILHSADWHLDAPLNAHDDSLRQALLDLPGKVALTARAQGCDLVLLAGDLFDGQPSRESWQAVYRALEEMALPVFITPGNHDPATPDSVWLTEKWPANVHIFTHPQITSQAVPELDCRIYGAAYQAMDCPALLEDFQARGEEKWQIGLLHADPLTSGSPYCPVTAEQVRRCGLDYLALGHIHKSDSFRSGRTLCAWPGCPMGRGFDELGAKGVLIVTLEDTVEAEFLSLDTPRFYDFTLEVDSDAALALEEALPPVGSRDRYRITLRGESPALDLAALKARFSRFPHLLLRDHTVPPVDLWATAGQDSLEGVYFGLLQEQLEQAGEEQQRLIRLAARLSRQILDGQEVRLP